MNVTRRSSRLVPLSLLATASLLTALLFLAPPHARAVNFTGHTTVAAGGLFPDATVDQDGNIYTVWDFFLDATDDWYDVDFAGSTDKGATWGLTSGDFEDADGNYDYYPRLAVDANQELYITWMYTNDLDDYLLGFAKSSHAGGTYVFNELTDPMNPLAACDVEMHPDIAVQSVGGANIVYVAWDYRANWGDDFDILFDRSLDEGSSWSNAAPAEVAAISDGGNNCRYPRLAVGQEGLDNVYVVYNDLDAGAIEFARSQNNGATFGISGTAISDAGGVPQGAPHIVATRDIVNDDGTDDLYVVWADTRHGNYDVFFDYSVDGGGTWHTDIRLCGAAYLDFDQDQPSVAVVPVEDSTLSQRAFVYVFWRDNRNGVSGIFMQEVIVNISSSDASPPPPGIDQNRNGIMDATDQGQDLQVDNDAHNDQQGDPAGICDRFGNVYCVWADAGDGISFARLGGVDSDVPVAPTSLTATAGNGVVNLSWTASASTDIDHYNVYRSTTRGTGYAMISTEGAVTGTTYSDTTVTNGTRYYYVVTAEDGSGNESQYSNEVNATPNATGDTTAPAAPTGLDAQAGNARVTLTWTPSTSSDRVSYNIYRRTIGTDFVFVANTTGGDTDFYQNTGLTNGTEYFFVVTCIDGAGNESADSNEESATPSISAGTGAPEAPSNLTAEGGNGFVTLDWDASPSDDVVSYSIYRATDRGSWPTTATIAGITAATTIYNNTGLTNGTAYWFVVAAVDADGNISDFSNDARATPNSEDTTAPDAPTDLSARAGFAEVSLSWTAPVEEASAASGSMRAAAVGVTSYKVYRSTESGESYSFVATVTAPKTLYLDNNGGTGLVNGVTYYYVVTALDAVNNESDDSNEASAAPGTEPAGGGVTPPAPAPAVGGGESGRGGGCFIATAAYGTPLAEEVRVLSEFRDRFLLTSSVGRFFVDGYKRVSPVAADAIRERPALKAAVRCCLLPLVSQCKAMLLERGGYSEGRR